MKSSTLDRRRSVNTKPILLGVGILVLAVGMPAVAVAGHLIPRKPIYTVTAIETGLQHHAQSWVGRTVLVRGLLGPQARYSWCAPSLTRTSPCQHPVSLFADPNPSTFQSRTYTQGRATHTVLSYSTAVLRVELTPSVHVPASPPQFPPMLYAVPLVGALLTDRFPRNGDVVVSVRLATSHLCATQTPALGRCSDGVILPPTLPPF